VSDHDDEFIREVAEALRAPVRVSSGLNARVMAAVRDAAPRPRRLAWLTRPRTVRLSPLAGLALAAGLAGVVVVGSRGLVHPAQLDTAREPEAPLVDGTVRLAAAGRLEPVGFALAAPNARSVALVGEFNDWDPGSTPLARGADGRWQVVLPLAAGRYEYAFLVDGARTVADPTAPAAAAGDFGAPNSVVTVGGAARWAAP
jgi:hypothetical protein